MKSFRLKRGEEAVSPVVGVMLMLVVTIIIAAVVSAFAGGLATTTGKAPTLAMDTVIQNDGTALNSFYSFTVQSVSDPIPTSDLKITTSLADNLQIYCRPGESAVYRHRSDNFRRKYHGSRAECT